MLSKQGLCLALAFSLFFGEARAKVPVKTEADAVSDTKVVESEAVVVKAQGKRPSAEVMQMINVPLVPTPTESEKKWRPVAKVVDRTYFVVIWTLILLGALGITHK